MALAEKIFGQTPQESSTVEGIFRELDTTDQKKLADELAADIRRKVSSRILNRFEVAVVLVNMTGAASWSGWRHFGMAVERQTTVVIIERSYHI